MTDNRIKAYFHGDSVLTEKTDQARSLTSDSALGALTKENTVQLSFIETLYLLGKKKIQLLDGRKKEMDSETFLRKASHKEPNFWVRFCVFKDLRDRGYIVKTALKFGADFRVYDRGIKPGVDHARWIVYPVKETDGTTWHEFSAKNRVAHSTKKRLMIGIVDEEGEVTYYEIRWTRP